VRVARCECGCAYVCGYCVCVRVFVSVRVRGDACVWWRECVVRCEWFSSVHWDASTIGNGYFRRLKELGAIPCFGVRHHCFPHVQWQRLAVHSCTHKHTCQTKPGQNRRQNSQHRHKTTSTNRAAGPDRQPRSPPRLLLLLFVSALHRSLMVVRTGMFLHSKIQKCVS